MMDEDTCSGLKGNRYFMICKISQGGYLDWLVIVKEDLREVGPQEDKDFKMKNQSKAHKEKNIKT